MTASPGPRPATESTRAAIAAAAASLPFDNATDFDATERGFVAKATERQVRADDGRVVWDMDAYAFLDGDCPDTANPSLWRQGQLLVRDGLFEVVPGIYQLRGFDLSVMTVVEGDNGIIVIDPLICKETAAAALALYREHRGDRPVTGMIYTHSHLDHFGGAEGVVDRADVDAGKIPILAPEGFLDHAVSENVYAGTAMARRAGYMYGAALTKGPEGQIGAGLGQTTSTGEPTLIPPTLDITATGQTEVLDGVRIEFQLTPGTEAPAEMNFYFPDHRALCAAENTSHTLHNILTLRGAEVRDAHSWSSYLTETIELWGDDLEVVLASHHWPTWGREEGVRFLSMQRDMYAYLHDQTLRLMNQGWTGSEIAEQLETPPALAAEWHTHGYYGSVSHNVKAIYQRYLGWYDGNPAHLWPHPPVAAAERYVAAMGGADAAVAIARDAFDGGDYRWCIEVLNHVLFAQEDHPEARTLQADAFEQLAYGAENGTWRSEFLSAAHELRHGNFGTPTATASPSLQMALTADQLLGSIAIRIDGPRAWDTDITLAIELTDERTWLCELHNGVLVYRTVDEVPEGVTTFTLSKVVLLQTIGGVRTMAQAVEAGDATAVGDPGDLDRLMALVAPVDPDFAIVTP